MNKGRKCKECKEYNAISLILGGYCCLYDCTVISQDEAECCPHFRMDEKVPPLSLVSEMDRAAV